MAVIRRRAPAGVRVPLVVALSAACCGLGTGAWAQEPSPAGLRYQPALEVPLTVAGVLGSLGPQLLTDETRSWTCRWCDRGADGGPVLNRLDAAARRHWRWDDVEKAHGWSNSTLALALVVPVGGFVAVRGGVGDGFGEEMLVVLESTALSLAATQGTKYLFRRARPWTRHGQAPPGDRPGSRESMLSFVSGHSSLAFAVAVSTGSLASLRRDEGREWVWIGGLTFAASTAYLRVAADRHYLTDVLAGAAVGAAVGWIVPRMVDRRPDLAGAVPARRERTVPLLAVSLGAGRSGGARSAVVLTGGLHGRGGYLSAAWGF